MFLNNTVNPTELISFEDEVEAEVIVMKASPEIQFLRFNLPSDEVAKDIALSAIEILRQYGKYRAEIFVFTKDKVNKSSEEPESEVDEEIKAQLDEKLETLFPQFEFYGLESSDISSSYTGKYVWVYISPEGLEKVEKSVDILGTRGYNKYRYPRSGRPVTTMTPLRPDNYRTIRFDGDINRSGEPILMSKGGTETTGSQSNNYVIPVSRYAEGMTRGLYFTGEIGEFCGTFYYLEPDSKVWLNIGSRYVTKVNKVGLAMYLFEKMKVKKDKAAMSNLANVIGYVADLISNAIRDELEVEIETARKEYFYFSEHGHFQDLNIDENFRMSDGRFFGAIDSLEDALDQIICYYSKLVDIDVIILTKMTGHGRLVSEVLDTRSRQESISNLYWEEV
jgi:hypothetical protein